MTESGNEDYERAARLSKPFARFLARWRKIIARRPWLRFVYRLVVAVLGIIVIIVGIILIPLPGPGWLTVFIGLTILGSEFHWARRLTSWTRMQLAKFWIWWRQRKERRAQQTK